MGLLPKVAQVKLAANGGAMDEIQPEFWEVGAENPYAELYQQIWEEGERTGSPGP